MILAFHEELLVEHGGLLCPPNSQLLEAALDRPKNKFCYGEGNIFALAASYAFALARDHPFTDGNKRIALTAIDVFLQLNGFQLIAEEVQTVAVMNDLAKGVLTEDRLSVWINENSESMEGNSEHSSKGRAVRNC